MRLLLRIFMGSNPEVTVDTTTDPEEANARMEQKQETAKDVLRRWREELEELEVRLGRLESPRRSGELLARLTPESMEDC
jgi:DNA/RNA-binding domain of Phe-tRNA-synthetase-like protein